ncbi:MAG: succinylglutamate desuccinylase/aspartoacylase family protein [Planctomycetota bacterium]
MNPSDSDEPLPHREHIAMRLLDLESLAAGEIHHVWLHVANNGIGEPIRIPILVAKGLEPGPTFGITAALHGNELNGISVIQKLFADLDPAHLKGTIVGVLALNVPGVLMKQRQFNDNVDLNSIAPGKPAGRGSAVYLHRFIDRVVRQFHYLIDLHTASVGRVNSLYVRADMNAPEAARMARLQVPEIIVHNPPNDTTLRGSAAALGIPAITVELRDPSRFQPRTIEDGLAGVLNVLRDLGCCPACRCLATRRPSCATVRAGCIPTKGGCYRCSRRSPTWCPRSACGGSAHDLRRSHQNLLLPPGLDRGGA